MSSFMLHGSSADVGARVQGKNYGRVRTVLISYGVIAASLILARSADGRQGAAGLLSPLALMVAGVGIQLLLSVAHRVVKRTVQDPDIAAQWGDILETVGDGVSVLLFAVGTLAPVFSFATAL